LRAGQVTDLEAPVLQGLEGDLGELGEALDEWEALDGELDSLGELKGMLAGKLGKCPLCGKKGEG
jgi:hypothetical protein